MTTEQRLERLERGNRWMRRIGAVGVAVAAALFLIGQGKDRTKGPQALVVRSLTMKDRHGKVRAWLGMRRAMAGGSPGDAPVTSPALALYDDNGKERALLFLGPVGSPGLDLRDGASKAEVLLAANGDMTLLKLTDRAGKNRVWLQTLPDGWPSLRLCDDSGRDRAVLGVTDRIDQGTGAETRTAENTLTMYDANGNVIWQAPR